MAGKNVKRNKRLTGRRVIAAQRRAIAVQRIKERKTLAEIGAELGVTPQAVWKMVRVHVDTINARAIEQTKELRQEQLDRLETLIAAAMPKAIAEAMAKEGETTRLRALVRLLERQAKLAGLDAAIVLEHQGAEGGPIQIEDTRARLLARVNDIAKRFAEDGGGNHEGERLPDEPNPQQLPEEHGGNQSLPR